MFTGFTPDTNDFLWGIAFNNNRQWFMQHKQIYTQQVYTPLKELAYQVQSEMQARYPKMLFNCKVTRIYRDARIPHANGMYKTHLWFTLEHPSDPDLRRVLPGLFFEIQGGSYSVGVDFYCDIPSVMEEYRTCILQNTAAFEQISAALLQLPQLKILGPEYKRSKGEVSDLIKPWFNRKRLCAMCTYDWDESLYSRELVIKTADLMEIFMPMYQFLMNVDQ